MVAHEGASLVGLTVDIHVVEGFIQNLVKWPVLPFELLAGSPSPQVHGPLPPKYHKWVRFTHSAQVRRYLTISWICILPAAAPTWHWASWGLDFASGKVRARYVIICSTASVCCLWDCSSFSLLHSSAKAAEYFVKEDSLLSLEVECASCRSREWHSSSNSSNSLEKMPSDKWRPGIHTCVSVDTLIRTQKRNILSANLCNWYVKVHPYPSLCWHSPALLHECTQLLLALPHLDLPIVRYACPLEQFTPATNRNWYNVLH